MKKTFISLAFTVLLLLSTLSLYAQPDRVTGEPFATRSEVIGQNGMVATSQPLATQIGLDILKNGGNAIDAAIAVNAALGLMEPTGSGVGGDLFAIVWSAEDQKLYGLNASGRSPMGLSFDEMKKEIEQRGSNGIPAYGMLPISVPGAVDGWFSLHDRLGSMPMEDILAPSIQYAREGFPVSELIAYYWDIGARIHNDRVGAFKEEMTINGDAPEKGEIMKRPGAGQHLR
ncbi:MAG: gamma-glutamyltransferase [Fodinibius sp.]|nr:gamma-glutamyltransferase [Fodinibius sp.]